MLKTSPPRPRLTHRSRLVLVAVGVLALALVARPFVFGGKSSSGGKRAAEPVIVTMGTVTQKPMPVEIQGIGHVQALASVAVRARISGQITKVPIEEGQDVKAGDVLFLLDDRAAQAALAAAKAALARDEAQAAFAKREAERMRTLVGKGVISTSAQEQASATAAASAATVEADKANVSDKETALSYTVIAAPIAGRLGSISVKEGNTVEPGAGPPLVTINQLAPISVAFSVPQKSLIALQDALARGAVPATATIPGTGAEPQKGVVAFIENAIDPQTGTLGVRADFDNRAGRLWPGQFVNVTVTLKTDPQAVVVPSAAVQTSQAGAFVFVVKQDQTAELRPVSVARTLRGETVITSGLQVGEQIVTSGQLRVTPGAKLTTGAETPKKARKGQTS